MGGYRINSIVAFNKNMSRLLTRIWGVFLFFAFQCARFVITILKIPIRGALVVVWSRGKILLVRKSYRKVWSIPGGLLKKNETWEQAAMRETFEEVGIRVPEEDLVFLKEVPGEVGPRDRAHLFEVEVDGPVDLKIDCREILYAEFVAPQEALQRDLYEHVEIYLKARRGGGQT